MIVSQRPMMLACALELSKLLQEQELVSWTESASVQKYIDKLMLVVEKLSNENDILTTYHIQVMQKVSIIQNGHYFIHACRLSDTLSIFYVMRF